MSAIGNPTAWRAQNLTRPYTSVWKMKRRPCCLPFKSPLIKTLLACNDGGSPIGLAGCGIRHFFAVTFGIWAQNWGGKREIKLRAGAGFRVFMGLGFGIRDSKGEQSGIRDFNPSFRVLLKPWSSRRHFFSHFAFASRTTDQRKKDTSKIDQRKNHQLAETNLLCLLCVWLCEQECVHSEKMFWAQISRNVKTLKALE